MNKRSNYLYRACFFVSLSCVFVAAILNLEYAHFLLVWGLEPKWPPETQNTRDKGSLNFYSYFKQMWRLPVRFAHFEEREHRWLIFSYFYSELNACVRYLPWANSVETKKHIEQILTIEKSEGKIFIFFWRRFPRGRRRHCICSLIPMLFLGNPVQLYFFFILVKQLPFSFHPSFVRSFWFIIFS